jgi:excisionase family DNA binding protein
MKVVKQQSQPTIQNKDPRRDGFATAEEAGRFLGLSRPMITKLVANGSMPHKRFGRSLRIPWSWLLEQVQQSSNSTGPQAA